MTPIPRMKPILLNSKEYICGPDWTIREIEPSHGYLLDETIHEVGADAGNFEIEHNTIPVGVGEDVIKGDIAIIKQGAVFTIRCRITNCRLSFIQIGICRKKAI